MNKGPIAPFIVALCACAPFEVTANAGSGTCTEGFDDPALTALITQALSSADANGQIPAAKGVVVGIASPTYGFRVEAFGVADDNGAEMKTDAVFGLGSIQKNFRWMMLHHLAEQNGNLAFNMTDAVGGILDTLGLAASLDNSVTFEQLTMHMTGLKQWGETPAFVFDAFRTLGSDQSKTYSYDDMVTYLTDDGVSSPLSSSPFFMNGPTYWYTDFGPLLASEAISKIGGEHVHKATRAIFEKFGMRNTTLQGFEARPSRRTPGFWANGPAHTWHDNPAVDTELVLSSAAGGLYYSTACDLLRYSQGVFHNPNYVTPQTLAKIADTSVEALAYPETAETADPIAHGRSYPGFYSPYFMDQNLDGAPRFLGHFGAGQNGHSSVFMHRLEDGTTFVVLANVAADGSVLDPRQIGEPGAAMGAGDGFATQRAVLTALQNQSF